MLDEDSTRFLVCKKIAQLVKLINHLSTQIAVTQHEVDFTTKCFEEDMNSLLKNHTSNLNISSNLLKQISEESENTYKTKYKENYDQMFSEYEELLISCQSDLTELTISISRDLAKIKTYINSIDDELEVHLKQLDEILEQSKNQYSNEIEKLNLSYKDEIIALDDESKEKLNKLQEQTSRKLDMLDRDFNRSLNDLKTKFGQINSLSSVQIKIDDITKYQKDQIKLKKFIIKIKEEMAFLISNTKAVLKQQILQKNKILENFLETKKNNSNELNEAKKELELNLKSIDEEYERFKNDFEERKKEMNQYFENLQQSFLNLTKSDLNEIQEQQLLFQLSSKKSSELIDSTIDDINQQIKDKENLFKQHQIQSDKLFNQLNKETQFLLNQIQEKNNEQIKTKEVHESELAILSKSQRSAIDDLISIHQKEIQKLKEKINQKSENLEINKKIEENRNIFNSLCFEKAQLSNEYGNSTIDTEILEMKEKYEDELKKLKSELESELEKVTNEEKLVIDACSESHRNEMFQVNTNIAQKYDEHLQSIRDSFNKRDFKEEDEKINSSYKSQLSDLEKQFEKLNEQEIVIPKPKIDSKLDEELEYLNITKKVKTEKIENDKKNLINDFLNHQKIEEDEYLRKMAEINYNSNIHQNNQSNEYERIRDQYHIQIQKLNIRIKELEEELNNLCTQTLCVEKISSDFDVNEKKLRDSLNELRAKSDIKISKTIHKADLKRNEVLKKIENFQKKFKRISTLAKQHTDQSTAVLKDAEEKTQEESKNLQQKVAHAISRLIKHFGKEKDKLNKKFNQKSEELKKLIDEQKSEIEKFINDSIQVENESKSNFENKVKISESNSNQELEKLRTMNDKKSKDLDDEHDQIIQKINQLKIDIENCKSRDEELQIIERLERQLSIKDKHINDLNDDISDCKKKIIQQEDVYNSHFGTQPSVAVFRPTTGIVPIPINLRLKQQQRPGSAAVKMRPMSTFMKNRNKKNDVS